MFRYYFDVREGARFVPDEEGLEFDSLEAAEQEAACTAAEIGRDRLPKRDAREVTVEVRNEHSQRVLTVKVSIEIDKVEPPPAPRAREVIFCEFPITLYGTAVLGPKGRRRLIQSCAASRSTKVGWVTPSNEPKPASRNHCPGATSLSSERWVSTATSRRSSSKTSRPSSSKPLPTRTG